MANVYEIRLKASALENLKKSRERVRAQLGTSQVGERLAEMPTDRAGDLANALLDLLDEVDRVIARAKAAS